MTKYKLAFETQLLTQLTTFWLTLGIRDECLTQQLAQRCLTHLALVLPEVDSATAIRIALNQAQYFFDQALAAHLGLDARQDRNQFTVFRAQLLQQKIATDFLFNTDDKYYPSLNLTREIAVPPESPLSMPKQTLVFAFRATTND